MRWSGVRRPALANSLPMTLRVYRKLSFAMVPLAPALIKRRLKQGKEDPARIGERRGNVVKAFVVLASGHDATPELADEIKAFVRERYSAYAYPRLIEFVPDLPKTLTGKIRRGQPAQEGTRLASRTGYVTEAKLDIVEALAEWGKVHDLPLLTIAISCLLAQPGCSSVIAGAMTPQQVAANAATAEWIPSAGELAEVDSITLGL